MEIILFPMEAIEARKRRERMGEMGVSIHGDATTVGKCVISAKYVRRRNKIAMADMGHIGACGASVLEAMSHGDVEALCEFISMEG